MSPVKQSPAFDKARRDRCRTAPRSSREFLRLALRWMLRMAPAAVVTASAFAEDGAALVDKSGFTLFHPVPENLLRELSPDRPDKTDSPFTVDAGHFQLEMDFANFTYDRPNSQRGDVKSEAWEAAPINFKVGLLNNVDFQVVLTPARWEQTDDRGDGSSERKVGFDGITPRLKINLIGNDGGFFALGLIPFVKVPLSGAHLDNGSVEGGLGIPWSLDIPGWDVGFQTTVHVDRNDFGAGYHSDIDNSVSIGHKLFGPLSCSVEFFSSVSTERGAGWVGTVDTWLTYEVNKNFRIDGGVYIGVTPAADDWHPWIGMTWRF